MPVVRTMATWDVWDLGWGRTKQDAQLARVCGKNRVVFWSLSHVFGAQNSGFKQSFGKALKNAAGEKAAGSRLILQGLF